MKKKKIIFAIICALILLTITNAIIAYEGEEKEVEYCFDEAHYYDEDEDEFHFTEILGDTSLTECTPEEKEENQKIQRQLLDFLVKKYDLDWKFESTEVMFCDFAEIADGTYTYYAGMADPKYNVVYMNTQHVKDSKNFLYRYVHELIHCFRYYNEGTTKFHLENENGATLGYYVGESYTDFIASEFLESIGENEPLDYFFSTSGYCYTTVCLQVLEYSMNGSKMYLENDMSSYHKTLKELTEKYIKDGKEKDYAEIFFYQSDLIMYTMQDIVYAQETQDAEKYNLALQYYLKAIYGNLELVTIVSNNLDSDGEEKCLEHIKHLFELEGSSKSIDEMLEYLESCLN